jgi:hypothetical protein
MTTLMWAIAGLKVVPGAAIPSDLRIKRLKVISKNVELECIRKILYTELVFNSGVAFS